MGVVQNVFLGKLAKGSNPVSLIGMSEARRQSAEWIEAMKVRSIGGDARVVELSGGNQQKVVIGKMVTTHPRVILLDEPSRGIDIGAKAEVFRILAERAAQGLAVVFSTS